MDFTTDTLWNKAKTLSKREGKNNDWCYVITLYNALGGNCIQLYVVDTENKSRYRVLANTDQDITYVLKGDGLLSISTHEATVMKKAFENIEKLHKTTEFLSDETVLGKDSFQYYE